MKDIFIAKNGQQQGPYSPEDIQQAISNGQISPSDLAWKEGMSDWVPVLTLIPLTAPAPVIPVALSTPQQPETSLNANEMRCPGCGNAVYKTQKQCPRCNHKLKSGCFILGIKIIGALIGLMLLLLALGQCHGNSSGNKETSSDNKASGNKVDATNSANIFDQLDAIAKNFEDDPNQTIGAKSQVTSAVGEIKANIAMGAADCLGSILSARAKLTEADAAELGKFVDDAAKTPLNGLDANGLVAFVEKVKATGRGGCALNDYFVKIDRDAIEEFMKKKGK